MRRVGKLMYEWVGFDHLPALLEQLAQDETNGAPPAGTSTAPPRLWSSRRGQSRCLEAAHVPCCSCSCLLPAVQRFAAARW